MNTLTLTAAALVLSTALTFSPAKAEGPKASGGGYPENATAVVQTTQPHYEWQYHYAGRHARYEGHWVLVR